MYPNITLKQSLKRKLGAGDGRMDLTATPIVGTNGEMLPYKEAPLPKLLDVIRKLVS